MNAAKRTLSIILSVISDLAIVFTSVYVVLLLMGFRTFILDSTSMEPAYRKGSFIIAETHIHPDDLKIGDVVIYKVSTDVLVMHRLISENTLKGDANQISEHIRLNDSNLIARVRYSVFSPAMTQVISFSKDHPWIPIVPVLVVTIIICSRRFSYASAKE